MKWPRELGGCSSKEGELLRAYKTGRTALQTKAAASESNRPVLGRDFIVAEFTPGKVMWMELSLLAISERFQLLLFCGVSWLSLFPSGWEIELRYWDGDSRK